MERRVDPVTFAVLAKKLDMTAARMKEYMIVLARSPIVNVAKDLSDALFDGKARLVAQKAGIPIHIAGNEHVVRSVIEDFKDDIHPGDAFIHNDPFRGNTHVADVNYLVPVFVDQEPIFWALLKIHEMCVGSASPASLSFAYTDMYMEGLHIPPLRIQKRWRTVRDVWELLLSQVRYREDIEADRKAALGSLRVAEKTLVDLCREYGKELVTQFVDDYINYADEMMAEEVRSWPDGSASREITSDPDQFGNRAKVVCELTKKDDEVTVDLTKSSDQFPQINTTVSGTHASVFTAICNVVDPRIPPNNGMYRHVRIVTRPGTIVHPVPPVGSSMATTFLTDPLTEAVMGCLSELVPDRASAGWTWGGPGANNILFGVDKRGKAPRPVSTIGFLAIGGSGAVKGYDGWSQAAAMMSGGSIPVANIEIFEHVMPVRFLKRTFPTDFQGDGQWRGGCGMETVVKPVKGHEITFANFGNGASSAHTFGVCGGTGSPKPGVSKIDLKTGKETALSQQELLAPLTIKDDEACSTRETGGGGFGDARKRDPELVREDARNYVISLERARDVYGVVLNIEAESFGVDHEATRRLREELKEREGN
jgi:N-methylhydantoinase B